MKELFHTAEALLASASSIKTVFVVLVIMILRSLLRQFERHHEHRRHLQLVWEFAALSSAQRREVIRLFSREPLD
jgi:hypothetical protein